MLTLLATTILAMNGGWGSETLALSLVPGELGSFHGQGQKKEPPKPHPDVQKLIDDALKAGVPNAKRLEILEMALKRSQELKDRLGEGQTLFWLGRVSEILGNRKRALELFEKSLAIRREVGDRAGEGVTLNNIGGAFNELGNRKRALEFYEQALVIWREVGDRAGEATTLNNIGMGHYALGDRKRAVEFYEQALVISREVGNRVVEAATLNNIGMGHDALGDRMRALEFYEQALAIRREVGDRRAVGTTLNNIGLVHKALGNRKRALEFFDQALAISREVGNRLVEAVTLNNIGAIHSDLGDRNRALEFLEQALAIRREVGDRAGEGAALSNLGWVHYSLGDRKRALEFYEQALAILREVGEREGEGATLGNIGMVHNALGDRNRALEFYEQALAISRELGDRPSEGNPLSNIGAVHHALGNRKRALEFYERALLIRREVGDRAGEGTTLGYIGMAHGDENRGTIAVVALKRSVKAIEPLRADTQGLPPFLQRTYRNNVAVTYNHLISTLIRQGRLAEALEASDLLKVNELESPGTTPYLSMTQLESKQSARYEALMDEIGELGTERGRLFRKGRAGGTDEKEKARLAEVEVLLESAKSKFHVFLKEEQEVFDKADPADNQLAETPTSKALQSSLVELGESGMPSVALYTIPTSDKLHTIIVTADKLDIVTVEVKAADLDEKIQGFRVLLRTPIKDPRPLGEELYKLLVKPVEDKLGDFAGAYLWSLDGNLRQIPMAALWDGKGYLAERRTMGTIAPAGQSDLTAAPEPWKAIAFSTSAEHTVELDGEKVSFAKLVGTKEEVEAIGKVLPTDELHDAAFTKEAFLNAMRNQKPKVVHVASHFHFVPGNDDGSFLLLGDGKVLTFSEFSKQIDSRLFDGVELLTLSACETALSSEANGRDFEGFAALAQRAGVRSVLATLWKVADPSTAALMARFYANRGENPKATKAEALRQAQLAMIRGEITTTDGRQPNRSVSATGGGKTPDAPAYPKDLPGYSHPFYWAPFVLIGNPR